ncbi:hypothetical protein K2X33_02110, partial [bacterium]|nr:hypothetical protein [bacterium]
MRHFFFIRFFAAISLLFCAVPCLAFVPVKLSTTELSELAGLTSDKVPEIARARAIARAQGAQLVTYGGTSREILDFTYNKVQELGSVDAYRTWLAARPAVHLLDWHRIASDLDFLILLEGNDEQSSKDVTELKKSIEAEFPRDVFHSGFDIKTSGRAFSDFNPQQEHFEAISNIPIGAEGVLELPQLGIGTGPHARNLARWGLEQYVDQTLDFDLNADYKKQGFHSEAFNDLKQVLRWVRYLSENPHMKPTPKTLAAIRGLLDRAVTRDRAGVIELLRQSDADQLAKRDTPAMRIGLALEKLQIYSHGSVKTRKLLDDFGITSLAKEAGIAGRRILEPLTAQDPTARAAAVAGKPTLGREIVVNHRTDLSAVQNVGAGAVWKSNNQSIIRGSTTSALFGDGLYAAKGADQLSYGDMYVGITLSANAVKGVDYDETENGIYVIHHLDAIAKNIDGSLKIQKIGRESLLKDQIYKLRTLHLDPGEEASTIRSLGMLLSPEQHPEDVPLFQDTLKHLHGRSRTDFLKVYFSRTGVMAAVLDSNLPFAKNLLDAALELRTHPDLNTGLDLLHGIAHSPRQLERKPFLKEHLTELVKSLPTSGWQLGNLLSNRQTMDFLRARFPDVWERTLRAGVVARQGAAYEWNLDDAQDVAFLRRMDASVPRNADTLKESLRIEILNRYPGRYPNGIGRLNTHIPDADLDKRYSEASRASYQRDDIDRLMEGIFKSSPFGFARSFPDHKASELRIYLSDFSGNLTLSTVPEIQRVLERLQKGEPLSASEQTTKGFFLKRGEPAFLKAMLVINAETRKEALDRLKANDGTIYRYLEGSGSDWEPATQVLREAFQADREWKRQVRQHLEESLQKGGGVSAWREFPWDVSDPQDLLLLQKAGGLSARAIEDEAEELRRRMAAEGVVPYPWGNNGDTFIARLADTTRSPSHARFTTLVHNHELLTLELPRLFKRLATPGAPAFFQAWLKEHPKDNAENPVAAAMLGGKPLEDPDRVSSRALTPAERLYLLERQQPLIPAEAWDASLARQVSEREKAVPHDAPERLALLEQEIRRKNPGRFGNEPILSKYLDEPYRSQHALLTNQALERRLLNSLSGYQERKRVWQLRLAEGFPLKEEQLEKLRQNPAWLRHPFSREHELEIIRDMEDHPDKWRPTLIPYLRQSLTSGKPGNDLLWSFPWNPNNAEDAELLREAGTHSPAQVLSQIQSLRRRISAEGLAPFPLPKTETPDMGLGLDAKQLPYGPLRDEY